MNEPISAENGGAEPEPQSPSVILDSVRAYLDAPRCAVMASLSASGQPQQAVVHYLIAEDHLVVNGRADRRWVGNLSRDPRVSLVVHDADEPLHWVGIRARAAHRTEGASATEDAMRMARRYGEDPADYQSQRRVSFRLVPHRIFEYGAGPADPMAGRRP